MNNIRSFGPCSNDSIANPEAQAFGAIIGLLNALLCKVSYLSKVPVTSCLVVTVSGTWGTEGDRIQVIRWFDSMQATPTSFVTVYVNEITNEVVSGLTSENSEPCS